MKNYDDLQRFKEKTHTLDIAFKDMSGQSQEAAEQSKWSLIRQLATENDASVLSSGQQIDVPQPQPLRGDEFSVMPARPLPAAAAASPVSPPRGGLLDSVAAQLAPAPVVQPNVQPVVQPEKYVAAQEPAAQAPQPSPATASVSFSLFPPAPPAKPVQTTPDPQPATRQPAPARVTTPAPAPRFGALFRTTPREPASLSKETLLKPLLEKIALCH